MKQYSPGLLTSLTVVLVAGYLTEHHGGPVLLCALLLGIAFNFFLEGGSAKPGIDVSAKTVLRIGVALLGFRVSFSELLAPGLTPFYLIIAAIIGGLFLLNFLACVENSGY